MIKRFSTVAGALLLVLSLAGAAAAATDIHVAGGQRGFNTGLGNHANVSAFVEADTGHLFYRGTINGVDLNLVCRPRIGMFDVFDRSANWPNADGAVFIWAHCVDKDTGLHYEVDVLFVDNGEPGRNRDRVNFWIKQISTGTVFIDKGLIRSGNVQIVTTG